MSGGSARDGTPRDPAGIEIQQVPAAVVRPLRGEVLRPGAEPAELVFPGDDVPGAFHLAARLRGAVVGIVSLSPEAAPAPGLRGPDPPRASPYRLRGMATAPAVRGSGVGALLLEAALREVARQGGGCIWCNARTPAEGFYLRHGFRPRSAVFELPGIGPHRVMERAIP